MYFPSPRSPKIRRPKEGENRIAPRIVLSYPSGIVLRPESCYPISSKLKLRRRGDPLLQSVKAPCALVHTQYPNPISEDNSLRCQINPLHGFKTCFSVGKILINAAVAIARLKSNIATDSASWSWRPVEDHFDSLPSFLL